MRLRRYRLARREHRDLEHPKRELFADGRAHIEIPFGNAPLYANTTPTDRLPTLRLVDTNGAPILLLGLDAGGFMLYPAAGVRVHATHIGAADVRP